MLPLYLFFKTSRPEFQAKDEGLILVTARISDTKVLEIGLIVVHQPVSVGFD